MKQLVPSLLVGLVLGCVGPVYGAEGGGGAPPAVKELKRLHPETVLVADGQPRCLVVVPDGAEVAGSARRLREAVRSETGATLTVRPATDFVDKQWRIDFDALGGLNLVALGNVNDNRLLSVLYGERYVVADSIYPGRGGYVIRTVHDPFARGVNLLVLAGSDADGVGKAVGVFVDKFVKGCGRTLMLPAPVIDVEFEKKAYGFFPDSTHSLTSKRQPQYTGMAWFQEQWRQAGVMDADGAVVASPKPDTRSTVITGLLARMGQTYFRTGAPELVPLMKQLVERNRGLLANRDKVHGMGARAAGHVHGWDLLEELPVWTDEDRLAITNSLLADAALGHEPRAFHKQVREGCVQALDENHGTFSALHSLNAWHYFHKYYELPESDYWIRCADAVFSAQASTFQILEDASGYLCYCPIHAMSYALKRRDLRYFERGVASHHARYVALACMNNLGLNSGFGDSSGVIQPAFFELLAAAAWYYRDPRLYWVVRNLLPQACGLRIFQHSIAFDLGVEPRAPEEWTGVIKIPLYEAPLAKGQASKEPVFAPKRVVDAKLFNKIVFKENWRADGQYLLLDGAGVWQGPPGPHGHKHNDINTIINFTAQGRMWLVDHTYQVRHFKDHSGVYCLNNGAGGYRKRTLAELRRLAETPRYGLTRTRFLNWDRAVFWRKGRWFLVVDRQEAAADGEHFARCSLRALGRHELRGKDLHLSQKGRFCKILSDGAANVDVETYAYANDQWQTFYEHAEPVVKIFQQDKKRTLKKGEALGFVNLLAAYASPEDGGRVTMAPVSEYCAVVRDGEDRVLAGIDALPGGLGKASMFVASGELVLALGAEEACDGLVRCGAPCDIHVDLAGRRLVIDAPQACSVTVDGAPQSVRDDGQDVATQKTDQGVRFELPPGRHALTLAGWQGFDRAAAFTARALAIAEKEARDRGAALSASSHREQAATGVEVRTVKLDMPVSVLVPADLDGDGAEEWVVGGEAGVGAYRSDGTTVWRFEREGGIGALDVGDLDGDGRPEVAAGGGDQHVYVLDAEGRQRWAYKCKASQGSIDGDPAVEYVEIADLEIADLENDGRAEVVAGANWVHVLEADGTVRWEKYMDFRRGRICGDFICGTVADLDGDGVQEIVAGFATSYPLLQVLDARDGRLVMPAGAVSPHRGLNINVPVAVAALDLFGDGKARQIACATTSRLSFFWHDHKRREPGGGRLGGPCVALSWFQADPGAPPTVLTASPMCGVLAVRAKPRRSDRAIAADVVWQKNLGEKITALLGLRLGPDPAGAAAVGTKQGAVHFFGLTDGRAWGCAQLHGAPVTCLAASAAGGAALAGKADGTVAVLTATVKATPAAGTGTAAGPKESGK